MLNLIAQLAKEPYRLPPSESRRLTMSQIRGLAERADGNPELPDAGPSDREEFWKWGRRNRLREYQIQALWDKAQPQDPDQ